MKLVRMRLKVSRLRTMGLSRGGGDERNYRAIVDKLVLNGRKVASERI